MAKDFTGVSENVIDKSKASGKAGSFTGQSEKTLEKSKGLGKGQSGEAAPGYPSPSKKEGGGKGVW